MKGEGKPLVWWAGEIKTPPFSAITRIKAGTLLRRLQLGDNIGLPHSRPMPAIGSRCHELRVLDAEQNWRIVYRIDADAIVIVEVFAKKSGSTPKRIIDRCKARLRTYDQLR